MDVSLFSTPKYVYLVFHPISQPKPDLPSISLPSTGPYNPFVCAHSYCISVPGSLPRPRSVSPTVFRDTVVVLVEDVRSLERLCEVAGMYAQLDERSDGYDNHEIT